MRYHLPGKQPTDNDPESDEQSSSLAAATLPDDEDPFELPGDSEESPTITAGEKPELLEMKPLSNGRRKKEGLWSGGKARSDTVDDATAGANVRYASPTQARVHVSSTTLTCNKLSIF